MKSDIPNRHWDAVLELVYSSMLRNTQSGRSMHPICKQAAVGTHQTASKQAYLRVFMVPAG
eukprot:scaffold212076_cov22-Tisochrysis_lutea.AAC.1